jgi:hypothetical protein
LGTYGSARKAAVQYDLAVLALKDRGIACTNFPAEQYSDADVEAVKQRLKPATPRMKCSQYRGVSLRQHDDKWDAISCTQQCKVVLGTVGCEESAAQMYDFAQLVFADYNVSACAKLNFPQRWQAMPLQQLRLLATGVRAKLQAAQLE